MRPDVSPPDVPCSDSGNEPGAGFSAARLLAAAAGALTALLGVAVVAGWLTGTEILLHPRAKWAGTQQVTALAFALAGVGLLATALRRRAPAVAAAAAVL